jgi:hypothetical protein
MDRLLRIERAQNGTLKVTGTVPTAAISAAEVNDALTRNPDVIEMVIVLPTEAQVRGLLQYAQLVNLGKTTTTVESTIAGLF